MTEMYQENELKLHRYNTDMWIGLSPAVAVEQLEDNDNADEHVFADC